MTTYPLKVAIFQKTGLYVVTSTDAEVTVVGSCLPHLTSHHWSQGSRLPPHATSTEQAVTDEQGLFVELN